MTPLELQQILRNQLVIVQALTFLITRQPMTSEGAKILMTLADAEGRTRATMEGIKR